MGKEKWLTYLRERWEKEWKEAKAERVAEIHNRLVKTLAEEKAHIDEVIVAVEILLQESLEAKMKLIRRQAKTIEKRFSDKPPSVIN